MSSDYLSPAQYYINVNGKWHTCTPEEIPYKRIIPEIPEDDLWHCYYLVCLFFPQLEIGTAKFYDTLLRRSIGFNHHYSFYEITDDKKGNIVFMDSERTMLTISMFNGSIMVHI